MKKSIPNLITLGNLLCGVIATMQAVQGNLALAALFIALGIFLDFFDGMAARLLGVAGPIGRELDSLADVVTSGVAPGMILFTILQTSSPLVVAPYLALLIPACSALRLAKFNIDERQTTSFLGLPTPANALVWASIGVAFDRPDIANLAIVPMGIPSVPFLLLIMIVLSFTLISELPLFSLKIHSLRWSDNKIQYIFLLGAILLIILFGVMGIALTILWYILLSILTSRNNAKS